AVTCAGPTTLTFVLVMLLDDGPLHCVNVYEEDGLAASVTTVPDGPYNVCDDPPGTVPDVDPKEQKTEPPAPAMIVRPGYRMATPEMGPATRIVGLASDPEKAPDPGPTPAPTAHPSAAWTA